MCLFSCEDSKQITRFSNLLLYNNLDVHLTFTTFRPLTLDREKENGAETKSSTPKPSLSQAPFDHFANSKYDQATLTDKKTLSLSKSMFFVYLKAV